MTKKIKKIVVAIILVAFSTTGILPAMAGNSDAINNLNQQKNDLKQNINATKRQLNNTVMEKNQVLGDLERINNQLSEVEDVIAQLTTEIDRAVTEINQTQGEIDQKQVEYDKRMAIFSNRLQEIYKYGDVDFMEVLLQSSDVTDFLTRFEYLRYIADNDKGLLDEVKVMKQSLEDEKASLVAQKSALEGKRQNQEQKSQELAVASSEKEILVAQIEEQEDSISAMLDAFEEESSKISAQIRSLQSTGGPAPQAGSFVWPAPSSHRITSDYGSRVHPVKKTKSFHTGVDIGASKGSSIVAAAPGKVIAAAFNSAYGNYIIVDHGGGVSTMYAHMSAFVARVGDTVAAGQPIGKVGSTGLSTGPHLHFEVRINGNSTDPRPYIG